MATLASRILVPVDFSILSAPALGYAITLAKLCSAKLYLLHVIENLIADEEDISLLRIDLKELQEVDHQRVKRAQQRLYNLIDESTRQTVDVECIVRGGKPFETIVKIAKECNIDLIVMTTHGRTGLTHMIIGSTAENVVRTAPCPVLTIRHMVID